MKLLSRRSALSSVLLFSTSTTFASAGLGSATDSLNPLNDITQYVVNLGSYLGYNVKNSPSGDVSQALLQVTSNAMAAVVLPTFKSLYGALPVNTSGAVASTSGTTQSPPYFVPSNLDAFASLNNAGNSTFISSGFSTPSEKISVSALIDQSMSSGSGTSQTYQNDPVSQAVANILMTPDYSYCLDNEGTNWVGCPPEATKTASQVMQSVIGPLPSTQSFFGGTFNQAAIPQLNSNSLIAPLMYSTTGVGTATTPSVNTATGLSTTTTALPGPLQAQNPAQQAANFIRYATAAVSPVSLASRNFYDGLYQQVTNTKLSALQRFQAASTLASYLLNLRVYAAQASVGIGNLYYILSKRMPQPILSSDSNSSTTTSQALSEYTMATWRLFNPNVANKGNTEWLSNIEKASAATMQKEIAVLLAEINYQLYLNRQQDERILLTNSMLLLQNARIMQLNGLLRATSDTSTSTTSDNQ